MKQNLWSIFSPIVMYIQVQRLLQEQMYGGASLLTIHTIPPYSNHLTAECEHQEEMRDDLQGNTQLKRPL